MKQLIVMCSLFISFVSTAQDSLSEAAFIAIIKQYHPLVRVAELDVRQAEAAITGAQAPFDPTVRINSGQKQLEGIDYYNRNSQELKIPVWYGIDLYAGREENYGSKLNPEETKGTLQYAGISVPLLQNLLTDKRRTALQQARLGRSESIEIRNARVNDLLRNALEHYWEWWEQYQVLRYLDSVLLLAQQRFIMTRQLYQLGDRPAIDTIEAATQVQLTAIKKGEAQTALLKARYALSTYLWKEDASAYLLPEAIIPAAEPTRLPPSLSVDNHPELAVYQYKLPSLRLQQRLAAQSFLPDATLKYQHITKETNWLKTATSGWFQNDYRYSLTVTVPLRFSEARASIRKARWKLEQTMLEQTVKQVQLQNKLLQYEVEWQQLQQQVTIQQELLNNYERLQSGEEIRFQNGESTLFLVNARIQKTIEGKQKLIELKAKQQKARASIYWSTGTLGQVNTAHP